MTNTVSEVTCAALGAAAAVPLADATLGSDEKTLLYTGIGAAITAIVRLVWAWLTRKSSKEKQET